MISPFPLLFFGGELTVCDDQGHDTIQVDTWIRFHAPTRIAEMVKVSFIRFTSIENYIARILHMIWDGMWLYWSCIGNSTDFFTDFKLPYLLLKELNLS